MLVLFDTSVLVAGFVTSHPKHLLAFRWLERVKNKEIQLCVSSHTLAECYAVLTALPLTPKISPATANYLINENIIKNAEVISLSSKDYVSTIKALCDQGFAGGIVYDAVAVKAAEKAKAKQLLTFNIKDFARLCTDETLFVMSP